MTRVEFQRALDDLRANVRSMGVLVLERLDMGIRALETHDADLARQVIEGDDTVNQGYLALESDCIDLFALQQPVASDLRFVAASFKIVTDLERIGDLATNLGHYAQAADKELAPDGDVITIGEDARAMVADALDAFVVEDVDRCYAIAGRDEGIDTQCQLASERIVRDLIKTELDEREWEIERLMDDVSKVLLTIRDLERVADHAVNIASRTVYLVESDPELIY